MTDKTQPQGETLGEFIRTFVFAILVALVIRTLAYEPFNIPSSSMVPTLLIGDYLFVSKYEYGYGSAGTFWGVPDFKGRLFDHEPKRGDVIVFKWPHDNSTDYIKRLIGLPGDRIQMREGILYINDQPVPRDRLKNPIPGPHGEAPPPNVVDYIEHLPGGVNHVIRTEGDDMPLDNTPVFTVPPHHYFFMGDNRDNSEDSRAPNGGVGYVPEENLVGKAEFLFFSLDGDTHFWEVWKWPTAIRWDRLFTKIR
jgi:signal peptidase I